MCYFFIDIVVHISFLTIKHWLVENGGKRYQDARYAHKQEHQSDIILDMFGLILLTN
jgi:hypothetical protein